MEVIFSILLVILSFLLLTTAMNVFFWSKVRALGGDISGNVSVLIPARNEASNIVHCLGRAVSQRNVVEVIVYDDHSDDGTAVLVESFREKYPIVRAIRPVDLPAGWTGKNFACNHLASEAVGDWLLFIDADTRLSEQAIPGMLSQAMKWKASFISCWPGLEMRSFWEKLLMPLLNFFVYSVYPAPISFHYDMASLGIAHGACILMKREAYRKIGGHARVRDKIFEDTELARIWRTEGERSLCFDGQDVVKVHMYGSLQDIWLGFQKNFYPGFKSPLSFWIFVIMHAALFLLPFVFFFVSPFVLAMAFIVWLMRILLSLRFRHPLWAAFLHPIAEAFLLSLAVSSWRRTISGKGVLWKGRTYLARG